MRKKWVYTFINFKKPNLFKILAIIVIILSSILSYKFINYNRNNEVSRIEYDPRKSVKIDYKNVNSIETNNNPDNLKVYFNDDKYIHIRNERNLEYSSISNSNIKDFSVYNDKSVILDTNNNVYIGDDNFEVQNIILKNNDNGPSKIDEKIYQYNDKIVVFDGNVFLYDTNKNYWTNLSKSLNIEKNFENIYFKPNYFITTTATEIYVYNPINFSIKRILKFKEINDISLDENDIYIISEKSIYKYSFSLDKEEKIFTQSKFKGEKILGVRYFNNNIYLLTDYGLSIYKNRKWENIEIQGIKKDFYISDNIYVITNDKIYIVGSRNYEYDNNYFFDGKTLYFKKDKDIYKIENKNAVKYFTGYNGVFEDFNPNDIVEAHFKDNILIFITKKAIYTYDFEKREYKTIENSVNNIIYNKNIYYLNEDKLYMYDLKEKKVLANDVYKYDINDDIVYYIDSKNRLNIIQGNKKVTIFEENYDFDLSSLIYLLKLQNDLLLINKNMAIELNLEDYKIKSKVEFEDEIENVKKYNETYFALIGKNNIYFFENSKLLNEIPHNNKIINLRGDYIVLKDNIEYYFYDKNGESKKFEESIIPFDFSNVDQLFALKNEIFFRLNTGEIYKYNPKIFSFNKLDIKYNYPLEKIMKVNDDYYCISNNIMYKFYNKEKVMENVIDYIYLNNKFYYLTVDNYIKSGDEKLFDNIKKVEGVYLSSYQYKNNIYLFFTDGIEKIDLNKFNISIFNIKIKDLTIDENYAYIVSDNKLHHFNLDSFNLESEEEFNNPIFSINNNELYIKEDHRIYNFSNNQKTLAFDFNPLKDYIVKKIYYYNNKVYFLGDNFYAVYSPDDLKWEYLNENIKIIDSNYVNDKIYIKKDNGEIGYLENNNFIEDNIPDFNVHNNYNDYFININQSINNIKALYKKDNILLVLTDNLLMKFDIKKYSWEKIDSFSKVIAGYSDKDGIIIIQKNKITKYNYNLEKKEVNMYFDNHWYSNAIVLNNKNKYIVYDKNLNKVSEKSLVNFPETVNEIYYIDEYLYLISNNILYVYSKIGFSKYTYYNPKFIYSDNILFVMSENKVYKFDYGKEIKLFDNVKSFVYKNNNYIYSDNNNDVYINNIKVFNYNIKGDIEYIYPIKEDKIIILDKKSNLYIYALNIHNVLEEYNNDKKLISYQIIEDKINKNRYLFWQSEEKLYYYDTSNEVYNSFHYEDNIIDYTVFNNKVYIMTNKKVKIYNKGMLEKTIELPTLPKVKYAFKFNDNYYIKDENDKDYLIDDNLNILDKGKFLDSKYLIYNKEILLIDKELYDTTGKKLEKPIFNDNFEYNYKIGEYLISTKNKILFNLYDFSSTAFENFEVHSNFIKLDNLLITYNRIKSIHEITELDFDNILIKNDSSIEKAISLSEDGEKEKEKIKNQYNSLLEKEKNLESIINNIKSELNAFSVDATSIIYNNLKDLENLENSLRHKKETINQKISDLDSRIVEIKQENKKLNEKIKTNEDSIDEYRKEINEIELKSKDFIQKFLLFFSKDSTETLSKKIEELEKENNINYGKIFENNEIINSIELQKNLELDELNNIQILLKSVLTIKLEIYEKEMNILKNELVKLKDIIDNFHSYYPQYVIYIPKYRINGENIIDFSNKNEIEFKKYDYVSFRKELMQYSYSNGYLQYLDLNNKITIRREYEKLETYDMYMKKIIKSNNYIFFENNQYFEKGYSNLKKYDNIFTLNGGTYILVNNKIQRDFALFFPYNYGSLNIYNTGNIEYSPTKNEISFNNSKVEDYKFERFSLINNELILEGNFFAYNLSGKLVSKKEIVDLKDQINEYYKIDIKDKLYVVQTNLPQSLKLENGKLYFDIVTKVAYNNYVYVPDVGIINLKNFKFIYLGNIDDLISADNGVFVDINGKIYKIENDILKEDNNIIFKKQIIYFDSKFKSELSNNSEYYYFNNKMNIHDFYNKIYNIFAKPLNAVYYNYIIFNNSEFLYILNNLEIEIIDNDKYKIPVVINDEIVDLMDIENLSIENYPEFLKKYSININIDKGIFESSESSKNSLYYNNEEIQKTTTEEIIGIFTNYNSKFIFTKNYIFELKDDNIAIRQKLNNIIRVKRILDNIIIELKNEALVYNLNNNAVEKYNGQKLSLNLDESKLEFSNYDIKFANNNYEIKDVKLYNEIFGLENVVNLIKYNEDYYFLLKSNNILKKAKKYELYPIPFDAKSIDLIKNEIILNKSYIFIDGEYKKLSELDLIKKYELKDLMYKNNTLNIVDSSDLYFDYYYNNTKTDRLFFDKILSIKTNDNKLYIIANNGIFDYENGKLTHNTIMSIEKVFKLFEDIIIKSNDKYYIFDEKVNEWDGRINNSVLLNSDYRLTNIYDLKSKLYLYQNKEKIDITNNDYFNIKPIGNMNVSYYNQNILIFKNSIYFTKIKEKIKNVFLKDENIIVIDEKNNEYLVTKDTIEDYKTDEFDFWSFDLLNNKLIKTEKKSELYFNGNLLKSLNDIKPLELFVTDEMYIENKYGIIKNIFQEILDENNIIYKRRINDSVFIKTNKSDFRFNIPEIKDLNVKITFDGIKFTEEISEKFEFKYQDFNLNVLFINNLFAFDVFKEFNVDDELYISNNLGIWKKNKIPYYLSPKSLENNFIKNGNVIDKLNMQKSMLNANLLELFIDSKMTIEERIKSPGDYIKIENIEKSLIDNTFVFDILGKISKTDNIYYINEYGIFSDDHIIKLNNLKKVLNSHYEYLESQKKFIIINGEIVDYSIKKFEISDNKWIWDLYENKVMFINKFDPNLKRVYLNNYFYDDVIIDIYMDENNIYMRDKTGYIIIYENNKPINMEKYRNQKLREFENEIVFSSKKYDYVYTNNRLYVKKRGDD
ncbi:hypothetical protein [Marinitoga litoralis]|uniref:hypothetical protein n=1 Tax=Marinitoga litoralis TaxID=570855 RepID=UPI001961119D|nr:hypothetical protein [Marinitoga litoralis]MBM7560292.1 putative nucleic acid-binding Zn-ribbon protein [Marinitoga litoralis]